MTPHKEANTKDSSHIDMYSAQSVQLSSNSSFNVMNAISIPISTELDIPLIVF